MLFLIFNRPETTYKVFKKIKNVKPKKLYIAADGPRENNINDKVNCKKARGVINKIDWDCEVKTLFRDKNLGCKLAVSSAIDWFFENEEMGIIMEDDCLPDQTFFYFCEELLNKYENDKRIMMIAGTNFLFSSHDLEESYFFSYYYPIWGWATWRRAWNFYDIEMKGWKEFKLKNLLKHYYDDSDMVNYVESMLEATYEGKINSWDLQWVYTCLKQNGLSIIPKNNLISNIGAIGTHMGNENIHNFLKTKAIDKIIHPKYIYPNDKYNKILFDKILNRNLSLKSKIIRIFKRVLAKIKIK